MLRDEKNKRRKYRGANKEIIQAVRLLIEAKPSERHTLGNLSAKVSINRNKLVYGFREAYRQSIHQFLIATRMKAAQAMLIHSDRPIKEIAALSGYSNAANFITAFKKFSGKTPGEYKKSK